MLGIQTKVLRSFNDSGADTLERYFAQLEYAAYWAIRMLWKEENIEAIYPELIDDLVIVRNGTFELHQVKTRNESRGVWFLNDVLPLLCKQYYGRNAFTGKCQYHFVSEQAADSQSQRAKYAPLFRLKSLLELEHQGEELNDEEKSELEEFETDLLPEICTLLSAKPYEETIDQARAKELLHATRIVTQCPTLRNTTEKNIIELGSALQEFSPGTPMLNQVQLSDVYCRLLILIGFRITTNKNLLKRRIEAQDVIDCRVPPGPVINGYPDWSKVPGDTILAKKLYLGEFHPTEWPRFHRQKNLVKWWIKRLESLGLRDDLDRFTMAIIDQQGECRSQVCRNDGLKNGVGPNILARLRPQFPSLIAKYLSGDSSVDDQVCLGILWQETEACNVWWDGAIANTTAGAA